MTEALSALPLRDQVEHLKHMLAEITTLPPWVSMMEDLHLTRTETRIFSALTNAAGTTITNQGLVAAITWDRPSEIEPGEETVKGARDEHPPQAPSGWRQRRDPDDLGCRVSVGGGMRLTLTVAAMLATALLALWVLPAHAADCAPRDGIIAKLDTDWGETLRAAGETDGGMLEVYANGTTRTWTILLTRPDMSACLLATGDGWVAPERPMPRPKGETL